jgi:hypothetical protein
MKFLRIIPFFFLSFLLKAQSVSTHKALENILKDVRMGMPLSEFRNLHTKAIENGDSDFRVVLEEKINNNKIVDITYYFDNEGDKPFYEAIIEFDNAGTRDAVADKLYGKFNHPKKEDHWVVYKGNKGFLTVAWTYEARLIYSGYVPKTEYVNDEMYNIPASFADVDMRINKKDDFKPNQKPTKTEGGDKVVKTDDKVYTCDEYANEINNIFESGLRMSMTGDSIQIVLPDAQKLEESVDFRDEYLLKYNKNGLKEVTFICDKDENKPIYESIFEFDNVDSTRQLAEMMFGKPSHPTLDDHWVIGISPKTEGGKHVISLAWVYENKLIVATNFPNTEFEGEPDFELSEDFIEKWMNRGMVPINGDEPNAEEVYTYELNENIAHALNNFEEAKGDAIPNKKEEYNAAKPLNGADQTIIRKNAAGNWRLEARFTTQSTMDDANLVYENQLKTYLAIEGLDYRLVKKSNLESANGKSYIWDVQTLDDVSTGVIMKLQLFKTSTGEYSVKLEIGK